MKHIRVEQAADPNQKPFTLPVRKPTFPEVFEVGEVVTLRSGGPQMTVSLVSESGQVHTTWFMQDSGPWSGQFSPAMLMR